MDFKHFIKKKDLTCLMIAVCASLAGSGFVSPLRESVTTDPPSAPSGSMLVRSVLTVSLYVVMLNMFPTPKRRVDSLTSCCVWIQCISEAALLLHLPILGDEKKTSVPTRALIYHPNPTRGAEGHKYYIRVSLILHWYCLIRHWSWVAAVKYCASIE